MDMDMDTDDLIGFPEGQLVSWGVSLPTAKSVALAFRAGKDMRALIPDGEMTPAVRYIITRLEQHSAYGYEANR